MQKKTYPNFLLLRTTPIQKSTLLESSKTARPGGSTPAIKKFFMGPNPNGPYRRSCDRAMRYSGFFGVRGPRGTVGDFLELLDSVGCVYSNDSHKTGRFCRPLPSWCSVSLLREILWKNMKKGRWSQRSGNGRLFFPKLEIFRSFQTSFFFGIITPCWVRFRGRFRILTNILHSGWNHHLDPILTVRVYTLLVVQSFDWQLLQYVIRIYSYPYRYTYIHIYTLYVYCTCTWIGLSTKICNLFKALQKCSTKNGNDGKLLNLTAPFKTRRSTYLTQTSPTDPKRIHGGISTGENTRRVTDECQEITGPPFRSLKITLNDLIRCGTLGAGKTMAQTAVVLRW